MACIHGSKKLAASIRISVVYCSIHQRSDESRKTLLCRQRLFLHARHLHAVDLSSSAHSLCILLGMAACGTRIIALQVVYQDANHSNIIAPPVESRLHFIHNVVHV